MHRAIIAYALPPLLALLGSASGCRNPSEEARKRKKCGYKKPCSRPNICLRQGKEKSGICARPCRRSRDCPNPLVCEGWYATPYLRFASKRRFCVNPVRKLGQSCTELGLGCRPGLVCMQGKCVRQCKKEGGCGPTEVCLAVWSSDENPAKARVLYRGCQPASQKEGQSCSLLASKGALCLPALRCFRQRCVRPCGLEKHKPCPKSAKCEGKAYLGARAAARRATGDRPDFLYCVAGASKAGMTSGGNVSK